MLVTHWQFVPSCWEKKKGCPIQLFGYFKINIYLKKKKKTDLLGCVVSVSSVPILSILSFFFTRPCRHVFGRLVSCRDLRLIAHDQQQPPMLTKNVTLPQAEFSLGARLREETEHTRALYPLSICYLVRWTGNNRFLFLYVSIRRKLGWIPLRCRLPTDRLKQKRKTKRDEHRLGFSSS